MGKALIIAEKPSVASDIAKALGGFTKHEDYFESDKYVLSSAVGHLLQITEPEAFQVKRGKWTFTHLPVIPDHFDLLPIEKSEPRLKVLLKLLKRKDIDALVNACDAGREGELIFRYIVRFAKAEKPIQRLWLQSMTPAAIREGFATLRDDKTMLPLADAATCRSEADWLVGINGTRAMTAFNSKSGGFQLTTVGRVQTPTLFVVVEREERIKKFVSRDYWELQATFKAEAGTYEGKWFDEKYVKPVLGKNEETDLKADRIWEKAKADAIQAKCLQKPGIVEEESKPTTQLSPALFDLTSLQREANGRFGFSASSTLKIAQSLYERHKVLTYPRTDSRALPEDYIPTVKTTLGMLGETEYARHSEKILKEGWVRPNKRIFNNAKVSDHFAIIPTSQAPKALNEQEQKIYDLVTRRFLSVFFPAAEFLVTTRITRVENEAFKSEGKVMVNAGWLAIHGREVLGEDAPNLCPVKAGETVKTEEVAVVPNQTKPPARFSEATLLSAMESAGKMIDDEELREAMSAKGLGTPATRAAIIEGLLWEKYIQRNGRELQATPKGMSLITLLRGLDVAELCSPELTGNWEFKLRQMEQGELSREVFMQQIAEMTRLIVEKTKRFESDTVPGDYGLVSALCPKCGGPVKETYKKFQCEKCDFNIWKIHGARQLSVTEADELLTQKKVGPFADFRSRLGKPFSSILRLTPEFKVEFDFGQKEREAQDLVPVDFSAHQALGPCPKCGNTVYENGMNYVCSRSVGPDKNCDFRTGKIILQKTIEKEQIIKLLATKKTDLLRFISKKNRPFFAHLVVQEGGKVGFEFAPRAAKGAAGKKGAKAEAEPEPEAAAPAAPVEPPK